MLHFGGTPFRKVVVIPPFMAPPIIRSTKVSKTHTKVGKLIQTTRVDVSLPDEVTIGLNTSFDSPHPLEKNLRQSPLLEGLQNPLDRR
jgi:hypothetical protein